MLPSTGYNSAHSNKPQHPPVNSQQPQTIQSWNQKGNSAPVQNSQSSETDSVVSLRINEEIYKTAPSKKTVDAAASDDKIETNNPSPSSKPISRVRHRKRVIRDSTVTATRSQDDKLQPFDFKKMNCVTIECWIVLRNLVHNNDDKRHDEAEIEENEKEFLFQRVTRNARKEKDQHGDESVIVPYVYIINTIPKDETTSPSWHLGFMDHSTRSIFMYIPMKKHLETFMRVLLCCKEYDTAEFSKNKVRGCPSKIGNMLINKKDSKYPLKEAIGQLPTLCHDDDFLEEQFEKGTVTKGNLVISKDLTWRFESEISEIATTRKKKAKKQTQNSSEEEVPKNIFDSDSSDDLTYTENSGAEEGDSSDSENTAHKGDSYNESELGITMFNGEHTQGSNLLKRKRKFNRYLKERNIESFTSENASIESSQPKTKKTNTTISENISSLLGSTFIRDRNLAYFETFLRNTTLTRDQFIEKLSCVNGKLLESEIFMKVLLQLIAKHLKEKKEEYVGAATAKLPSREQCP